jgi:hypothetical protein
MLLASLNGMGVFGMFVAGGFNKKRNRWSVLAVLALAMSFLSRRLRRIEQLHHHPATN